MHMIFKCTNSLCMLLKYILCSVPLLETDWIPSLTHFKTVMWHLKVLKFDLHLWDKLQLPPPPPPPPTGLSQETQRCQKTPEAFAEDLNNFKYSKTFFTPFSETFLPILFNRCNLLFKITASNPYNLGMIKMIWENKYWFVPLEDGVIILSWLLQLALVFVFIPHSLSPNHRFSPLSCFLENLFCAFWSHIEDRFIHMFCAVNHANAKFCYLLWFLHVVAEKRLHSVDSYEAILHLGKNAFVCAKVIVKTPQPGPR